MSNRAVIFDTNAYRDLCATILPTGAWTVASIRAREQLKRNLAYATPYVIMELASHLWDESDPDYGECRRGLTSLYQHCCTDSGDQLRVMADAESLVAMMLYQKTPPAHEETTQRPGKLARAAASAAAGSFSPQIANACKEIADQLDVREGLFVNDMKNVVLKMNPAATGWEPYANDKTGRQQALAGVRTPKTLWQIALAHVIKARILLGVPITDPQLKEMTDALLAHAGASVALYREILERIVSTGCDVSKRQRANWLWDMQIAMGIGEDVGVPPKRVTLVTADGAIVDAAAAASLGGNVILLGDYLGELSA